MMQLKSLPKGQGRMDITTLLCSEQRSYGQTFLNERLTQLMLQSVWHYSKSQGQWNLETMRIISLIYARTRQSQGHWQLKTGMTWMLSRSPKGTWCDYCKMRWSTHDWRGQTQAIWQISSKRRGKAIVRHYCHACAQEVQGWNGKTWTLQQQIDYAKGKETLDVQFE